MGVGGECGCAGKGAAVWELRCVPRQQGAVVRPGSVSRQRDSEKRGGGTARLKTA